MYKPCTTAPYFSCTGKAFDDYAAGLHDGITKRRSSAKIISVAYGWDAGLEKDRHFQFKGFCYSGDAIGDVTKTKRPTQPRRGPRRAHSSRGGTCYNMYVPTSGALPCSFCFASCCRAWSSRCCCNSCVVMRLKFQSTGSCFVGSCRGVWAMAC